MKDEGPIGHITKVEIAGLFGYKNIELDLANENIIVLTGLNGAGKSHVLKLIYGTIARDEETLASIQFKSVNLYTENGDLKAIKDNVGQVSFDPQPSDSAKYPATIPRGGSVTALLGQGYNGITVVGAYSGNPEIHARNAFSSGRNRGNAMFIEAERLNLKINTEDGVGPRSSWNRAIIDFDAAEVYAEYLYDAIRQLRLRTQRMQASQQRNLVKMLIEKISDRGVNESRLKDKYNDIKRDIERCAAYGLMGAEDVEDAAAAINKTRNGAPSLRKVFDLIYDNQRRVLDEVMPLVDRLDLLMDVLRDSFSDSMKDVTFVPRMRGSINSSMSRDGSRGLTVAFKNGKRVPLSALSSGEKQLLAMYILSLIGTPRGGFLFIDEPEISLHPRWQKTFIPNLEMMAKSQGIRIFLATHSPIILNGRWEMEREIAMGQPPFQAPLDFEEFMDDEDEFGEI